MMVVWLVLALLVVWRIVGYLQDERDYQEWASRRDREEENDDHG